MTKAAGSPFHSSPRRWHVPYRSFKIVASLLAILTSLLLSRGIFRRKRGTSTKRVKAGMQQTMMGAVKYVEVSSGRGDAKRYAATDVSSGEPVSIRAWMEAVASNSPTGIEAASALSNIIASPSYASILFETPGSTWTTSKDVQMEFVLVNRPALQRFAERNPDREAFAEHFDACRNKNEKETVCSFANLGGDAQLVSPLPQSGVDDRSYSHLAAFVRTAPQGQVAEFWRAGASRYLEELQRKQNDDAGAKTWFSTNGMGVAWLHLRLDSWPKYYSYGPFGE